MWRQRSRWFKGGHLFILSPSSVFFEKHKHMTLYQKSLYWICLIANMMAIYAEPIMFAMPFLCLALDICAYGMDKYLFWTHLSHAIITNFAAFYFTSWDRVVDALKVRTMTARHIYSQMLPVLSADMSFCFLVCCITGCSCPFDAQ